ncbi:hypothetical protein ALI22I_30485 [Saccharothrix sp. ALI-22-I]|uniref:hypothetical protein n=1 Tax=Saccharothrix sp. ALI-22-I TaxID=1933778 RepID=UPI00097BC704|nr:hypothetical protein [Saccharothrix sp. ALI-22-I]ONI84817.1 hypothetical protein ALI22I_30485 [Saccharothrix sp. ALI-22-I]
MELLAEVGAWTALHGDAIHGAGPAPEFTARRDTRLTRSGNRLFVHVFGWQAGTLVLPGLADRVRYASFLHDGVEAGRDPGGRVRSSASGRGQDQAAPQPPGVARWAVRSGLTS